MLKKIKKSLRFIILFVSLYCNNNNNNNNNMKTPLNNNPVTQRSWDRSVQSILNRLDEMRSSRQITIEIYANCLDSLCLIEDSVSEHLI